MAPLVAILAAVLALSTAGPGAVATPTSDRGGTGSAAVPELDWATCGNAFGGPQDNFTCTYASVPLDYDRPRGTKIKIALKRWAARQPDRKLGTLFINPGGPGGSGVEVASFADLFPARLRNQFDIVGFDPRGVARSAPLVCFPSFQELDRTFAGVEWLPINRGEYRSLDRAFTRYTDNCEANAGAIIDHMSTADVARDLDLLRRGVGDDALTFAGYSYGSQIGSVYANLFPDKIRAMVVDGVLDPVSWTTGRTPAQQGQPISSRIGSDVGTSTSLKRFFALCREAGAAACPLLAQGDPEQLYSETAEVLRTQGPVRIDDGGWIAEVSYQALVFATLANSYSPFGWDYFAYELSLVVDAAGVAPLPESARLGAQARLTKAGPRSSFASAPMPQTLEGFDAVMCTDATPPTDRETWWRVGRARDRVAPYFGNLWTWNTGACASWPGVATDAFRGPWTAKTANPVLVVGNTVDPATPISGARAVADLLPGSRLLTVVGEGHTSWGYSTCADQQVARYLATMTLPAAGLRCAFDFAPFEPEDNAIGLNKVDAAHVERLRDLHELINGSLPGGGR